jgi:capsular polysaccharide biosynthesis protein
VDALDIVRVLRRRWPFTVAGAAVLAVLVGAVVFLVPQQYKVTAISLVTPTSNTNVLNPYTSADKSQPQMAALLVTVLNAPQTADEYTAAGATGTIQVTNGNGATDTSQLDSPFITITVNDKSAAGAVRTAQVVYQRAVTELKSRQDSAKVDTTQRLTLTEVLPATDATTTRASQLRAVGLVAALGLVLGILGIVVADRVLSRRKTEDTAEDGAVADIPETPLIPPAMNDVVPPVRERKQRVPREVETTTVVPPVVRDESPTIQFSPIRAKNDRGGGTP